MNTLRKFFKIRLTVKSEEEIKQLKKKGDYKTLYNYQFDLYQQLNEDYEQYKDQTAIDKDKDNQIEELNKKLQKLNNKIKNLRSQNEEQFQQSCTLVEVINQNVLEKEKLINQIQQLQKEINLLKTKQMEEKQDLHLHCSPINQNNNLSQFQWPSSNSKNVENNMIKGKDGSPLEPFNTSQNKNSILGNRNDRLFFIEEPDELRLQISLDMKETPASRIKKSQSSFQESLVKVSSLIKLLDQRNGYVPGFKHNQSQTFNHSQNTNHECSQNTSKTTSQFKQE